ncbi:MAG: hypothetical protein MJH10_10295 [Epibacterium sp.]|nr:hypothetical protein [Epibacterium sp.]NQX73929.1 hypothetical protein [Epibacterium sp.]
MTTRAFPYRTASLPAMGDPIGKTASGEPVILDQAMLDWMIAVNLRLGGQGQDAVYDLDTDLDATKTDLQTLTDTVDDAVADDVLTPAEKRQIVPLISSLQAEETELVSAASNRDVSSAAYETEQDDFAAYLATLTTPTNWNSYSGNTDVDRDVFNGHWQDLIEARDALRSAIEAADIRNSNLASRAASSTSFSAGNDFGPYPMDRFANTVFSDFNSDVGTKGTADSPGRELLAVEVTIQNANPGDPLLIWFDGQLNYRGGVAQFVCWHEKCWIMRAASAFKDDYFGASTPRSTSDDDYLTINDAGRKMTRLFNRVQERQTEDLGSNISTEANNSNQTLSIPITGTTVIAAPNDIDTVSYKVVFAFVIDREQISYQSGANTGWKNANSSASDWSIEDLDLIVMNMKERQS